jgi:hypothetical protein
MFKFFTRPSTDATDLVSSQLGGDTKHHHGVVTYDPQAEVDCV